jgi:hypothetical protein
MGEKVIPCVPIIPDIIVGPGLGLIHIHALLGLFPHVSGGPIKLKELAH